MNVFPNSKEFKRLSERHPGKMIPVGRCFLADGLSPVAAYRRCASGCYGFILESVERGDRMGRYSFVGAVPEAVFTARMLPPGEHNAAFRCRWEDLRQPEHSTEYETADPLLKLAELTEERSAISAAELQAGAAGAAGLPPLVGGAVGWIGYDLVRGIEPRLLKNRPVSRGYGDTPDLCLPFYRTVLAFDHIKSLFYVVYCADPRDGGPDAAYERARGALEETVMRLRAAAPVRLDETAVAAPAAPAAPTAAAVPESNFERSAFLDAVTSIKEYIRAGDVIQTVLSQRLTRATTTEPFEIYRSLRAVNPSPYMFYLRAGTTHLVGASPEVMVKVEDGQVTMRPIAGTRRRGADAAEDAALAAELSADPKELAEHVMLLDLGRNDVGRAAEYGSVVVDEKMAVEYYSHVMHLVSNVTGRVRAGMNAFDVLRACFPAGTVSGAPKVRAMEIIDELEPDARGPYAGAVGLIDYRGNLNTAIAIRTFVVRETAAGTYEAHVQAGAGIVADSVPESEYEETLNKAKALLRALDAAEARLDKT